MKVTLKSLVLLLVICLCHGVVSARSVDSADSTYKAGDYAGAVELYRSIADRDGVSSQLYYNLGNAYARGGDYGNAMVNYLRSLRLDPSNGKAKENIRYIESKVLESNRSELRGKKFSLDSDSPSFFSSVKLFVARDHSSDTWAVWAAVAFVLFVGCVATYIFSGNVMARKIGFFGGFIMFGVSAVALIFSFMAVSYKSDEGVIVSPKVRLMSEASVSSKPSPVNLTRGTRMTVLDTYPADDGNPQWYKVRLNSDFVGWLQSSDFVPVGM